jgi:predicted DNA-binding protein YlxM (UPF0122 family)
MGCASNNNSDELVDASEIDSTDQLEKISTNVLIENQMNQPAEKTVKIDTSLDAQIYTKVKNVSAEVEAERKAQRDSILRQSVAKSINKEKTCEDMLVDYEEAVKAFVKNPDDKGTFTKLLEFRKDTPFNLCKQNATFLKKVNEIELLMEEDEE